jgi:hypothetical protein
MVAGRVFLGMTLAAAAVGAHAQTADIRLRTAVVGENVHVTQTRSVRVRTSVTNLGPDAAPSLSVRMITTAETANFIDATVIAPCVATQGALMVVDLTWNAGPIAGGETRSCDVELRARPNAEPTTFFFSADSIVAGFVDPVTNNNRAFIAGLLLSPVDIVQDMVLTIRSPPGPLPQPPDFRLAEVVLMNRGPDTFPSNWRHFIVSEMYLYGSISSEQFLIAGTGDPDCQLVSDDVGGPAGGQRTLQINFTQPIPAGSSQACTLAAAARVGATGLRSLRWEVARQTPGLLETHPADNTAFLVMQYSPLSIPVDARWALLSLSIGLAVFGLWRLRSAGHR